ncbi:MAG TPA: PH domain-containing protein [Gemmataceae bacterium]|nr:PH domain-containing protein [Gemmataceae bacterium]
MPTMPDARKQAVTGLIPPQVGEAVIRIVWPSVAAIPPVARLGQTLMRSIIGAPLAWLLLAPFYFKKVLPFLATRYMLTNRRLMIQRGLKFKPTQAVALADIDDVRVKTDDNSEFYRSATLEIMSKDRVVMTLPAVPGYESFRHAIINACRAFAGKMTAPFVPAKVDGKAE